MLIRTDILIIGAVIVAGCLLGTFLETYRDNRVYRFTCDNGIYELTKRYEPYATEGGPIKMLTDEGTKMITIPEGVTCTTVRIK